MSTKIYTGLKFNVSSFAELQTLLQDFRAKVVPQVEESVVQFLAHHAVENYDRACLESPTGSVVANNGWLSGALNKFWDRIEEFKKGGMRDPVVDFKVDLSFFYFEDQFYGILQAEQPNAMKLLRGDPRVLEYAYFNNTDKPEDVSEEEWTERGRVWDGIFKATEATAEAGFSQVLHSGVLFPDFTLLNRYWKKVCPSFEKRVAYWSKERYMEQGLKDFKVDPNHMSTLMRKMREIREDVSPKANAIRAAIDLEVRRKLRPSLSLADFGVKDPNPARSKLKNKKAKII